MVEIGDLKGIPENKKREAVECLDDLLTYKDGQGNLSPVIAGYNWYTTTAKTDRVVTFSHIHGTEDYKLAMSKDLIAIGYDTETISKSIREKSGAFLWTPDFNIRDRGGKLLTGLRIKDLTKRKYLDLDAFSGLTLDYSQIDNLDCLIGEEDGWQLDVPFGDKDELIRLAALFLRKSGFYIYDEKGCKIPETREESIRRAWPDAYKTPVLVFGESSIRFVSDLPNFEQATKICLTENGNEISFIVHKNLEPLRSLSHYERLTRFGFKEEKGLANRVFVEYIDEVRKV